MKLNRTKLQKEIHELYAREHTELGEAGTLALLEKGREWDFSGTLTNGGVVVFPHAGVADCGHQIAAAVHACLDSGADKVVVISVLHAFTDEMENARIAVANGDDPANWPFWGIQGDGVENGRSEYQGDHALISFRHFWDAETKRRGITPPQLIERYPYLAGGHPEKLPGIDELARLVENAVIVTTADPFHHGIGYGTPPDEAFPPDETGIAKARESIQEGIDILGRGDYWGYNQQCVRAKSDARDAGQLFRHLRGPMSGTIHDIAITDATELYQQPPPTWVAGALIEWKLG